MNNILRQSIENTLCKYIKNLNYVFVFPTQICASMWAEKATEITSCKAVALDRFIAWDEFKQNSIKNINQQKNAIPSVMRSIFAEHIVLQNAKSQFLKYIILPEYAKSALRFAPWIATLLPSLNLWKSKIDKKKLTLDEQDKDFLEIYNRYKEFLDNSNLFDPAWETPPFKSDGNKYVIFFPEILMDYFEYEEILKSTSDVEIIKLNLDKNNFVSGTETKDLLPNCYNYTNSRNEIKEIAHYLLDMHNNKNIPWNKICISVSNMQTYET